MSGTSFAEETSTTPSRDIPLTPTPLAPPTITSTQAPTTPSVTESASEPTTPTPLAPDTTQAPVTTTTPSATVTTQTPATTATPSSQASLNQFEQWLRANNYAQPAGSAPVSAATANSLSNQSLDTMLRARRARQQHVISSRKPLTFEQSQQIMLSNAPPANRPVAPYAEEAFNAMLQQNMPLTPGQVVRLHQQIDNSQRAAAIPPNIPPKPVSSTIVINLAPGTTPPAIRLALGFVTSLVFVDSTGAPWPIASFDIGNPKDTNMQWDGKSNVLLMQAMRPYSYGDIVIRLVGLPTPITLQLVSGQRVVDYRVDLHVPGIGPNARDLPIGSDLPPSANQLLLNVLDGVAPAGSKTVNVVGADAQAWVLGNKMYLRTRLTVLSPGWIGKMTSPDGMQAYELPRISSVLVSRYGEPVEIKIEGL